MTSTADNQEQQATENVFTDGIGSVREPAGLLRDYLQSFDRRKSDSNYVLGTKNNPSKKEEKMDLVDEIKRLSDHLMMLNTMKTEMGENGETTTSGDSAKQPEQVVMEPAKDRAKDTTVRTQKKRSPSIPDEYSNNGIVQNITLEKRPLSRTKMTDPANLSSRLESRIVQSQIMRFSNSNGTESHQVTTMAQQHTSASNGVSALHYVNGASSVRTATRLIEEQHKPQTPISQPPWMLKCKRTKFRMTELSRDVPQNAPDSHKTIFIEQAATNTKDCLLQLLDKYNCKTDDEFTKRCLDIDRSVIPSSSSSSSSSIASLPPTVAKVNGKSAGKSSKVIKTSTESTQSSSGETVTKTTKTIRATRTVKTTTTSSSSSTSQTSSTVNTSVNGDGMEWPKTSEVEGLENKSGPCHPEFAKSIPRHFSLSLNWDKDSLEETTMNSLNAFFQKHSVGSSAVKQIQQQMEAKCGPQN